MLLVLIPYRLLYGRTRVYFPIPKLYVLQVGLEAKTDHLLEKVPYDMHLGDACLSAEEKYGERAPERFVPYDNDMRSYALVANGITYMQRIGNETQYAAPANVTTVAEYLGLLLDRGIFVDMLSDKEVCDMTMAQFSRDDILIYQGREEGRVEGIKAFILDKVEDGVEENTVIQKLGRHFGLDEKLARQYYRACVK